MADAHTKNHDYHIIDPSPWPLIGSIGAMLMAIGGIAYMRTLGRRSGTSMLGMTLSGPWILTDRLSGCPLHDVCVVGRHDQGSPCGRPH